MTRNAGRYRRKVLRAMLEDGQMDNWISSAQLSERGFSYLPNKFASLPPIAVGRIMHEFWVQGLVVRRWYKSSSLWRRNT